MATCLLYVYFLGNVPVFKVHPQNTQLLLNSTNLIFSLTCNAIGALSHHWNKQDGDISSSTIGVNTNNLTFINIRPEDSGNYYCVAINGSGRKSSDSAAVTIKGTIICRYFLKYMTTYILQ